MNGFCACCCAGEGLFNTVLEGGQGGSTVYLQSMSFQKFKKSMAVTVRANNEKGGGGEGGGPPPEGEEMVR